MTYALQSALDNGPVDLFPVSGEKSSLSAMAVQETQMALGVHGYGGAAFDGVVGPKTVRVFREFKRKHGLPDDTILDEVTLAKIVEENRFIHFETHKHAGEFGDESHELMLLPLFERAREVLAKALEKPQRRKAEVNVGAEIERDGITYQIQMVGRKA